MKRTLELLDTLINFEKERDIKQKAEKMKVGQGSKTIGDSFMFYHLNCLKDLIIQESSYKK